MSLIDSLVQIDIMHSLWVASQVKDYPILIKLSFCLGFLLRAQFAFFLVISTYYKNKSLKTCRKLMAGGLLTALLVLSLKFYIARPRPLTIEAFPESLVLEKLFHRSFPSGHSACAAFMALVILKTWELKGMKRAMIIGIFIILAYTRVWSGAHFISDVFAGLIVGIIGFFGINFLEKKEKLSKFSGPLR